MNGSWFDKSWLVRVIGFPATLIHGDTSILDRWLWLSHRLPRVTASSSKLLDVGCGSGAFTIGSARRGYQALGLSWDERNQRVSSERAAICRAPLAAFDVYDVRNLDQRKDLRNSFEVAVCCEVIEHVLDDGKLIRDIARCLKMGGVLFLTTPNIDYRPIDKDDYGPYPPIEDGRHVRKGYSAEDLRRLCAQAGLTVQEIGYITGFFSQKVTALLRFLRKINHLAGWALVLPLRPLPVLLDSWVSPRLGWPGYSITLHARKTADCE